MNSVSSKNEYRVARKLMGCAFELIVVHWSEQEARRLLNVGLAEITRIESLLSEFQSDSCTSTINREATKGPLIVDPEVFHLLKRCQGLSTITQGAFDITVGPLKQLYRFKKEDFSFPSATKIQQTLKNVGYQHLHLEERSQSVYFDQEELHLSFAAIGKGYAADRVKKIWQDQGLTSGVINASGDLTAFGKNHLGKDWQLSIRHPDLEEQALFNIPANNLSLATSGDYEQFFMHQNIRYSHSIHPKTGYPVRGVKSVSIISPSAELSDALATAVFVMGPDTGIHLINQLPDTHCILIDDQNRPHFSKNIETDDKK